MRNWHNVVPNRVARNQIAWERRQSIMRAWRSGVTQKELASFLNLSPARVGKLCGRAIFEERDKSPIEKYLNLAIGQ